MHTFDWWASLKVRRRWAQGAVHVCVREARRHRPKLLMTRRGAFPGGGGVTVVQQPPVPTPGLPGARTDLNVDVKARLWQIDVAVVCPATKPAEIARQSGGCGESWRSGQAAEVQGERTAVCGGLSGPSSCEEVLKTECDMTEPARRAAANKILRSIGIELMHKQASKQAYMMAKLIEELRRQQPRLYKINTNEHCSSQFRSEERAGRTLPGGTVVFALLLVALICVLLVCSSSSSPSCRHHARTGRQHYRRPTAATHTLHSLTNASGDMTRWSSLAPRCCTAAAAQARVHYSVYSSLPAPMEEEGHLPPRTTTSATRRAEPR